MKVIRCETQVSTPLTTPYEVRLTFETSEEARFFWLLFSTNVSIPSMLHMQERLTYEEKNKMEKFMTQVCKGIRA